MTAVSQNDIQALAASAVIELFVLDATIIPGGSIQYFHAGTNELRTDVVWQGQTYTAFPIMSDGFEWSTKGTLPRPKLIVSALNGLIGGMVRDLGDLVGATVILKRCFAKHLDAVNFANANQYADPTAHWDDEPWIIERKSLETSDAIEFELVTPMDVQNAGIPKRRVTANICQWHDASVCIYSIGGLCGKRLTDCREKWSSASTSAIVMTTDISNYTREAGSFITDGFTVGAGVVIRGFLSTYNNGMATVSAVTATVLTVTVRNPAGTMIAKLQSLEPETATATITVTPSTALPFGGFPGTAKAR